MYIDHLGENESDEKKSDILISYFLMAYWESKAFSNHH